MARLPDTRREDIMTPNAEAIVWALSIEPPGAAELGLLVFLAPRVDETYSVEISLRAAAKVLNSTTATLSRALTSLMKANLVTVEALEKVGGVYEAGRGKLVRLNHPSAAHMSPTNVAEREAAAERRAAFRASLPDEVWNALKPTRPRPGVDDEGSTRSAPMVAVRERGGLRLLTAGPDPAGARAEDDGPQHAAR